MEGGSRKRRGRKGKGKGSASQHEEEEEKRRTARDDRRLSVPTLLLRRVVVVAPKERLDGLKGGGGAKLLLSEVGRVTVSVGLLVRLLSLVLIDVVVVVGVVVEEADWGQKVSVRCVRKGKRKRAYGR